MAAPSSPLLLLALAACATPVAGPPAPDAVEAELSERVGTVVTVRWTTPTATSGFVRFGEDGALDHQTPTTEGTDHEAVLLGMPADTEVSYEVVSTDGETESATAVRTLRTEPLPGGIPVLSFVGDPAAGPAYQVVPIDGTANLVLILDAQGRVVWYQTLDRHVIRAFVTPGRDGVVICFAAGPGEASAQWLAWDGSVRSEQIIASARMDVAQLPDGTLAAIIAMPSDESPYVGDAVVELAPDGTTTEVWNSWDALDSTLYDTSGMEPGEDFTHANAIDYHPALDAYTISLTHLQTLLQFDRSTGARRWEMFGPDSDWTTTEGTLDVVRMHQHAILDDAILLFDNGADETVGSRVAEYAMDEATMTLRETWAYTHDPPVYTYIKGDVTRLGTGGTLAVWSTSGEEQVIDADGNVVWQLSAELGYVFLFVDVLTDLYPEAPP